MATVAERIAEQRARRAAGTRTAWDIVHYRPGGSTTRCGYWRRCCSDRLGGDETADAERVTCLRCLATMTGEESPNGRPHD